MFAKLAELEKKFKAMEILLASPEVAGDPKKFREHAKAFAEMEKIVTLYREYGGLEKGILQAQEILDAPGGDEELRGMAEEEVALLQGRLQEKEKQLCSLLLPLDPIMIKTLTSKARPAPWVP